jgi:hypothetical protein
MKLSLRTSQGQRLGGLTAICAMTIFLLSCGRAAAIDLRVDIGVADDDNFTSVSPNEVQAGYSGFDADPQFNGGGSQDFRNALNLSRVVSGVTISMAGGGNGLLFYDLTTDVTGPLGDLAEDGVFVVDDDLTLRFTNLPAGTYQMTMYHHQANLIAVPPPFDIYLGPDPGAILVAQDVAVSSGFNSPAVTTSSFQVTSDGILLLVRLDGNFLPGPSIPVFLNAFTLIEVPEPTSGLLLGLGAAAVAWRGVRRRSRRRA